ncbi:hypothetical protein E1218_07710 [Kribbella turkmenica]|uniref:Nudix hydrolase domain-containing protein n=1 Tax=Kribbella turkmenica TaxID=2530375 RepID=A0A4R4XC52_9ACTN|nr:hypothetical protein [Kribbella turkmenica]TDD28271.1 hypothetical protein E1218_07710 [Kribbella turkmenica]
MSNGLDRDGGGGIDFDVVVGWSNIVGAGLALIALVIGALLGWSRFQAYALFSRRRRYLLPALRRAGWKVGRWRFGLSTKRLVAQRVTRGKPLVQEEIAWISSMIAAFADEELPGWKPRVRIPFTFAGVKDGPEYERRMLLLADGYDAYAVAVRRRWLLRSTAGPLVAEEYACARATAGQLRRWSTFHPLDLADEGPIPRGSGVELRPVAGADGITFERAVRLVAWPYMNTARSPITFASVGVSFQPYRVALQGQPVSASPDGLERELMCVVDEAKVAQVDLQSFDGVLTRWHGPGLRVEMDRVTGRQKLHLCISETTYFAFRATQSPAGAAVSRTPGLSRLLSLSLLAMDRDEKVLLVRRSDYVVYPGAFASTVSGNCELASREGVRADVDPHGFPDAIAALVRETREELGLDLSGDDAQLGALGIVEVDTELELGTHLLIATALLPGSADDFTLDRAKVDPVEGVWEVGETALVIDLPKATRTATMAERYVNWLRSSPELVPHAVGGLLLLLITRQQLRERRAERAASAGRAGVELDWTVADLARWLKAPPPPRPPDASAFVSEHALWQ